MGGGVIEIHSFVRFYSNFQKSVPIILYCVPSEQLAIKVWFILIVQVQEQIMDKLSFSNSAEMAKKHTFLGSKLTLN